jgi:hypothetical protein
MKRIVSEVDGSSMPAVIKKYRLENLNGRRAMDLAKLLEESWHGTGYPAARQSRSTSVSRKIGTHASTVWCAIS